MGDQTKVELLREHAGLLAKDADPDVEAKHWDWASVGQVREWIECGSCARGDIARALRNIGCTPLMCSAEITTEHGERKPIGLLAAEGKISFHEARRRAILASK
jgi:hypothetical protein